MGTGGGSAGPSLQALLLSPCCFHFSSPGSAHENPSAGRCRRRRSLARPARCRRGKSAPSARERRDGARLHPARCHRQAGVPAKPARALGGAVLLSQGRHPGLHRGGLPVPRRLGPAPGPGRQGGGGERGRLRLPCRLRQEAWPAVPPARRRRGRGGQDLWGIFRLGGVQVRQALHLPDFAGRAHRPHLPERGHLEAQRRGDRRPEAAHRARLSGAAGGGARMVPGAAAWDDGRPGGIYAGW